jgi:hypothetical protein
MTCSSLAQQLKLLLSAPQNFRTVQAPSLDELLAEEPVPQYSYDQSTESVSEKPFLFCHTSGSSGLALASFELPILIEIAGNPKPIAWNMTFINALDSSYHLPAGQGASLTRAFTENQRTLVLLPCFHVIYPLENLDKSHLLTVFDREVVSDSTSTQPSSR